MPFVDENEFKPVDLSRPTIMPEKFRVTPGAEDIEEGGADRPSWEWGAALRRNSELAALAVSEEYDTTPEPGHDNFRAAIGTPAEAYPERLADIPQNSRALAAFSRQIAREEEDRRRLEGQPWWQSLITEGAASLVSPTTLIPGGAIVRGARGGIALGRTALTTAAAGGLATGIQEGVLQGIEETRTAGESAVAIGASTLLSGMLGGAAGLLSRGQWNRAVQGVRSEIDDGVPPPRMGMPAVTIRDEDIAGTAFNEKVPGRPFFYREDGRGAIQAEEMEGGFLRIGLSGVETAGEGLGMPLYLRVMKYAEERGLRVVSDESVSADAQKVYAALERRGFEVIEKPSTRIPEGEEPPRIDLRNSPDYVRDAVNFTRDRSDRAGLTNDIERMAYEGKTAVEIQNALSARLDKLAANNPEKRTFIREVRTSLGIPSQEDFAEFDAWRASVKQRIESGGGYRLQSNDNTHVFEVRNPEHITSSGVPSSAGAAARLDPTVQEVGTAGRAAGVAGRALQFMNPNLRLSNATAAAPRRVVAQLAELGYHIGMNTEGRTMGPSVETRIAGWMGGLAKFEKDGKDAFVEYAKEAGVGRLARTFAPQRAGIMNRQQFREEAGRAAVRGDVHPNPHVQRVAESYRTNVAEPLKKAAIELEMLPADVKPTTAVSYLSRMWKRSAMVREEPRVKAIMQNYFLGEVPKEVQRFDRAVARRVDPLQREIDYLETAKLRRAEEMRAREEDETAAEFDESDIRQAIRIVRAGAPKPKGVKTLTQFIVEEGGLKVDEGGELRNLGITNRARPGLVRKADSEKGWHLDDMARHAWEKGYFPDHIEERPTINEFLAALDDDFTKRRPVVKQGDEEAYRLTEMVERLEQDLGRIGVDTKNPRFSTSEEVKGMVANINKALDAEGDAKIKQIREKLGEIEYDARLERDARFGDEQTIRSNVNDIVKEVYDTLTGRLVDGAAIRPEFIKITKSGPFKDRTFNIPDTYEAPGLGTIEDFLERDISQVSTRMTRLMSADIELTRRFGDVSMKDQIAEVRADYEKAREGKSEKERVKLKAEEDAMVKDIEAVRDLLRGTFKQGADNGNWAAISRSFAHFNYIRSMGGVTLASLGDPFRTAMVHGLSNYMQTVPQLWRNTKGIKASVKEAQLAGNATERVMANTIMTMNEMMDPLSTRGPVEAFLANMSNVASTWNGIRLWTDFQKQVTSVITQNRIIGNAEMMASGRGLKDSEREYMAFLGIDEVNANKIADYFKKHGETIDKVRVANTKLWLKEDGSGLDNETIAVFRAALNKDVNSTIVQRSVGDIPLFAHTPTGRMLFQFKSFALASHQRVLMRGLQEDQVRFIGGMIALTAMGMATVYLRALAGNTLSKLPDFEKNPGWWVAEGFDASGVASVPMEMANMFEKVMAAAGADFNPVKAPLTALDEGSAQSTKAMNRDLGGMILGPSFGLAEDVVKGFGGAAIKAGQGEEITQGQKNAMERTLPFQSFLGPRQMLRYMVNPRE